MSGMSRGQRMKFWNSELKRSNEEFDKAKADDCQDAEVFNALTRRFNKVTDEMNILSGEYAEVAERWLKVALVFVAITFVAAVVSRLAQ